MSTTYAVNICDLSECFPLPGLGGMLLADFVTVPGSIVRTDPRMVDSGAVILNGPAADDTLRVESLVELLQTSIGPRKIGRPVRVYKQGTRGGWSKVHTKKGTTE